MDRLAKERLKTLQELDEVVNSEGFNIIIKWLWNKLSYYKDELTKVYVPDPACIDALMVNNESWSWYLRGKILGLRYVLKTLLLTQFFVKAINKRKKKKNFNRIQLWRGFCTGIAEFLSYVKQIKKMIIKARKEKEI